MEHQNHTEIKANARLFSELFLRGKFAVPWYQRYYDWKPEDVEALLQDIDEAVQENRSCYFLGAIILVDDSDQQWYINDGQQRMITMSLIYAALCRKFYVKEDSKRETLALSYIFLPNSNESLNLENAKNHIPRIDPSKNDSIAYRQLISGYDIGTNGMLVNVWKQIINFFEEKNPIELTDYFDFLKNHIEVACLYLPSHIDPNAVYETINCRGKKLDDIDLIRNYIYSYFDMKKKSGRSKIVHEHLELIRTNMKTINKAAEYVRCYLQCRYGFLRKDSLYHDVRHIIQTIHKDRTKKYREEKMFSLAKKIGSPDALGIFQMVISPSEDLIQKFNLLSGKPTAKRNPGALLRELKGYKITQSLVYSILTIYIKCIKRTNSNEAEQKRIARVSRKNLNRLSVFILRNAFVAPKFEPSRFEKEFANFAKTMINKTEIIDEQFSKFLRDLDDLYYRVLDDKKFEETISQINMTGPSKIKQFLLGINYETQKDAKLLNEKLCTIEHILPKSSKHWGKWHAFDNEEKRDWINRLGNLTLIGKDSNKPSSEFNGDFLKKRQMYSESGIKITRALNQYDNWSPSTIESRQREMAKLAIKVWKFE